MTKRVSIPHDALVLVGDGQKALFLRNDGDATSWNLIVEQVFNDRNPPTHAQGTDRPGRTFKRAAAHSRSSVEATDWHELSKRRFSSDVADAVEAWVSAHEVPAIVVVAPARTLAELRDRFCEAVKARVVAEIAKDLTKHSVEAIEAQLASHVQ
ncbi:MAG: host attachment protein [Variibacter sp.]